MPQDEYYSNSEQTYEDGKQIAKKTADGAKKAAKATYKTVKHVKNAKKTAEKAGKAADGVKKTVVELAKAIKAMWDALVALFAEFGPVVIALFAVIVLLAIAAAALPVVLDILNVAQQEAANNPEGSGSGSGSGGSLGLSNDLASDGKSQAADYVSIGERAYNGDADAKKQIIEILAEASIHEWADIGLCRSVVIAQAIQETGWLSFQAKDKEGIQPSDNNILGMNDYLMRGTWDNVTQAEIDYGFKEGENWNKVKRKVPQYENGTIVRGPEDMCAFRSMEDCMIAYSIIKVTLHPDLAGNTDIDYVIPTALKGYATDPDYYDHVKTIIESNNLQAYDKLSREAAKKLVEKKRKNNTSTGQEYKLSKAEQNALCRFVASFKPSMKECALAITSCVFNRADNNFGGYGEDPIAQMQQMGGDPDFSGTIPSYVKGAVKECMAGKRTHTVQFFSKGNRPDATKIGKYYFY